MNNRFYVSYNTEADTDGMLKGWQVVDRNNTHQDGEVPLYFYDTREEAEKMLTELSPIQQSQAGCL